MGPQLWFQGAPGLFPLGSQGCQTLALTPQDLTSAWAGCGGEKSIFGCVQPVPICTLYEYIQIRVGYIGLLSLGDLQALTDFPPAQETSKPLLQNVLCVILRMRRPDMKINLFFSVKRK